MLPLTPSVDAQSSTNARRLALKLPRYLTVVYVGNGDGHLEEVLAPAVS